MATETVDTIDWPLLPSPTLYRAVPSERSLHMEVRSTNQACSPGRFEHQATILIMR